ncbi:MAG: plasmid pRiA4b ORF-3 family protein [Planctomycetaceae bacterium]|nr:plasmid pRiA4b ORF-3 family protein [Planctomycetaceae bacterium]
MVMVDDLNEYLCEVPEALQPRFREIAVVVDRFCNQHLDSGYRDVCRRLLTCFCQPATGIERGKPASWAAGIVYEAGQLNFLTDPSSKPYIKSDEIAKGCGVSAATMHNKGTAIRETLDLRRYDLEFCIPNRLQDHPLSWIMELPDGIIVDIQHLPEEAKQQLSVAGKIPDPAEPPPVRDWRERIFKPSAATGSGTFYTLKIVLKYSEPEIWRRVQVPDCLLDELHEVIQVAMGWENYHLHEFVVGKDRYLPAPPDDRPFFWDDDGALLTDEALLSDVIPPRKPRQRKPFEFTYVYDFGDSWEHAILVEKIEELENGSMFPVCLEGERACPPEDCGGIWGLDRLLHALQHPKEPENEDLLDWAYGYKPEEFSPKEANATFKRWSLTP